MLMYSMITYIIICSIVEGQLKAQQGFPVQVDACTIQCICFVFKLLKV